MTSMVVGMLREDACSRATSVFSFYASLQRYCNIHLSWT